MSYKLFLDDTRIPCHCVTYMHVRIGPQNPIYLEKDWVICRNIGCFIATIKDMGMPDLISFDHDLSEAHYGIPFEDWRSSDVGEMYDDTGYDCAVWLTEYCLDNHLQLPEFIVHSMNPVGVEKILALLNSFKRTQNDGERI